MRRFRLFLLWVLTTGMFVPAVAQTSDSVDVLDYDLTLDLSQGAPFNGVARLTMKLLRPCATIGLDLIGTADSVTVAGSPVEEPDLQSLPVAGMAVGEVFEVAVWYHSPGHVERSGWGGFHFDNTMSYNLGVAFGGNPHVYGRSMFPCRDNFTDKATYTLRLKCKTNWTAECGGICQSRDTNDEGCECSVWRIAQPTPTYLVSVSQANFRRIETAVTALYGTYPVTLGYTNQNTSSVRNAFRQLDSVVPMYERCFGPYRWGRIGYIATKQGSMEHVNNIALYRDFMGSMEVRAQSTIAHELGHAWFGNLVTCSTEGDMWFNEGGASFTAEVARESTSGREASNDYYQQNLEQVMRTTHLTDGGYYALSGMPHSITYGSTTYDKGALVWHSLRGWLGEGRFYAAMTRLMADKAFGTVDAAEVRDSLSRYTGEELTDFFRFHVFSPGHVGYYVDLLPDEGAVAVRAYYIGTDSVLNRHRVPLTLVTWDGQRHKVTAEFEGQEAVIACSEFGIQGSEVRDCWLDPDCELSDAATNAEFSIGGTQELSGESAHVHLKAEGMGEQAHLFVEHHWGDPRGLAEVPGVKRASKRFWVVHSDHYTHPGLQVQLRYTRANYSSATYANLDKGFYWLGATLDSMVVMYRMNSRSPWEAVSHQRSGNENEGFFMVDNAMPGEYALAVVDTVQVGMESGERREGTLDLFPNPLRGDEELTLEVPTEEPFTVTIFDAAGRRMWQKTNCRTGEKCSPKLAKGTYLVRIENNFLSLQSNLIKL